MQGDLRGVRESDERERERVELREERGHLRPIG